MINEKKVSPKEKSCLLCKRFDKKYIIGFAAAILLTVVAGALYTRLKMSPKDMSVTTEGSGTFTVNWRTEWSTSGKVYISESSQFLPFVGKIGKEKFYDERDQEGEKIGRYYNHSVVVTGLDPQKEYSFRIGGEIFLYGKSDNEKEFKVITTSVREELPVPDPLWGGVVENGGENAEKDTVVMLRLEKGELSNYVSTVTSESGTWTMDANSFYKQDLSEPFDLSGDVGVIMWVRTNSGEMYMREGILEQFAPTGPMELDNHLTKVQEKELAGIDRLLSVVSAYFGEVTYKGQTCTCDSSSCNDGGKTTCCAMLECGHGAGYDCIADNGGTANCSGGKWSVALNPQVWTCWGDHYDAGCDSKWTPGDPADPTPPPTQPSPSGGCERKNIKVDVSALWSDGSPGATFIIDEVGLYFNGKEKKISSANGKPMVSYTISPDMFNWDGVANNGGVMGVSAITEGFESLDYGEHKGTKAINICEERWKTDHLKLELLKKGGEPQPPVPLPPPPSGECHKDNCALDTENYDQPTSCTKFSNDDFGPGGICMSGTQYRGEAPDPYGHTIDYEEDENYKWKTFTGKCPGTPACTSEGKDCEWICRVPPKEQTVGDRTLSVSLNPTKLDVNSAGEMTQDLTFTASIQYYGGKSGDKYNCAIWGEDFRYGEKEEVINDSFTSSIQLVVKKDDFNNNEPSFSTSMNLVCNAGNLWTDNQYVTKSITIPIQKEGGTPPPSGETALIMGDIENFDGVKVKDADGKWSTTKSGNLHFNYSYKYSGTGNTRVHCEVTGFENGISLNGYSQEFSDTGNKLIDGVVQVMIPKDTFLAGSSTQDPKANYKCSILDTVVAVSDSYTFEIEGAVAPPVSRDLTLSIDSVGGEQGTTLYTEADGSLIEDKEVKFDVRFKPKTANETLLCRLAAGNDEFGSWIKQIDNQSGNWQEYNNSTFTIKQGKYNSTKPASLSLECFGGTQLGQPGNKCSAGLDCRYGVLTIDVSSTGTPVVVDPKIEITNPRVDKSGEMKAVCSGDKKGEMKYCDLEGYIHSVTVDVNFDKGSYASGYEDKLRCKALWLEYKEGGDIKFISTLEVRDIEGDSGVVKNIKMTFPEGKDLYIREDIPKLYTDCWIVPINDETPKLVKDLTHFVIEKIIPPSTGGEVVTPEPTPTPPVTTWVDCSGTNFVTATKGTEKLVTAAPGVGVNSGDGRKYRFRASESKWWDEEASQERHEIFVYVVDGNCKIVNRNFTVTWTGGSQTQSSVKDSGEPNTFGMYNPLGSYNVRIDGGTSDSVNGLGMGNVPNSKGHTSFILVFQEMSGQGVIDTENLLASQDLVSPVQAQDQNYPIEGASLTFTDESGKERKIETDANGLFSIDLDTTRKYKMRVEKEGYKTYETDFEPLENVNYNLKIILEAGDLQSYGGFSSMEEISVTHSISKGWNLMTLDVVPAKQDYMASDLLSDMNSYGLFISRIMRYRDGRWDVYRIESQDANDFRLKLGEGYVLKSDKKGEYTVDGKGVGESVPVRLGTGWNLIGIPYSESGYTAVGIIDSANGSGAAVDTVTKWESKWVNVVKEEGLVYGHDFKIDKQGAYFIRNLKAIYWEP